MATATLKRRPEAFPQPISLPPVRPVMHRFTVEQYHEMGRLGILKTSDRVELLEGLIVHKMTIHPPHSQAVNRLNRLFNRLLPEAWALRIQQPITLARSEPEPDVVIAVGPDERYDSRHPRAQDVVVLIEVGDDSAIEDRTIKLAIYAAANIPVYWIVNIPDRRIEVYANPRGGKKPTYRTRTDYAPGQAVPVVIAGKTLGSIPVSELLP